MNYNHLPDPKKLVVVAKAVIIRGSSYNISNSFEVQAGRCLLQVVIVHRWSLTEAWLCLNSLNKISLFHSFYFRFEIVKRNIPKFYNA